MSEGGERALPVLRDEELPAPLPSLRGEQARLFARLLVSDIRLYHEEEVIHGRLAGDLASRLADQIGAARAAYRRRFDDERAFDRELIRILAGGDPRKLGTDSR